MDTRMFNLKIEDSRYFHLGLSVVCRAPSEKRRTTCLFPRSHFSRALRKPKVQPNTTLQRKKVSFDMNIGNEFAELNSWKYIIWERDDDWQEQSTRASWPFSTLSWPLSGGGFGLVFRPFNLFALPDEGFYYPFSPF